MKTPILNSFAIHGTEDGSKLTFEYSGDQAKELATEFKTWVSAKWPDVTIEIKESKNVPTT